MPNIVNIIYYAVVQHRNSVDEQSLVVHMRPDKYKTALRLKKKKIIQSYHQESATRIFI